VRDIVVLLSCRFLFHRIVFHVHAGGFTDVVERTPFPVRIFARWAYRKPDVVIQLTEKSPPDAMRINARRIEYVANGLKDDASAFLSEISRASKSDQTRLLFVGVVGPSKGVMVLLQACVRLLEDGLDFVLSVMGRFYSPEFEAECRAFINANGLDGHIEFVGVMTGDEKWQIFCQSDIFCFPSHFESENQSLVILEAMQFGLPCVATDWRSMSTMVEEGATGYIVPVKDPGALASRIGYLIQHPALREKMGKRARHAFLGKYTDDVWRSKMEAVLKGVL
jgi:glycosyltransferase involved in cell wall biosynthesis